MGGRGVSSGRQAIPSGYHEAGRIKGIPFVRSDAGIATTGLPIRINGTRARFLGAGRGGEIVKLRIYRNGKVAIDIDWSHAFKINGKKYPEGTVHFHVWHNERKVEDHRLLSPRAIEKYRSIIENANTRYELKWL